MNITRIALRIIIAFISLAVLLLAVDLHHEGNGRSSMVYFVIEGALFLGGLLYERHRWQR